MKTVTSLCLLFLITGGLLAAAPAYKHAETAPTRLEKETFARLKKKFPSAILDRNLKTLRELAESPAYLNFLSVKYPHLAPFNAFADVADNVVPAKTRYLTFCREHLGISTAAEITDAEQFVIHHVVTASWHTHAHNRSGEKATYPGKVSRSGVAIFSEPKGKKLLERRLGIPSTDKLTPLAWRVTLKVFMYIVPIAEAHLLEDIRWVKMLFEKHGQSDGMLWVAVQDPILFDRILHTFSTDTTFLKCLYEPVEDNRDKR